MSAASILRWHGDALVPLDDCDLTAAPLVAADSWLVEEGRVLGLDLHRARFAGAASAVVTPETLDAFWAAALAELPRTGAWFPRVEADAAGRLLLRVRPAPERQRSVVLATATEPDPRVHPRVKGPDLDAMLRLRTAVQPLGAGEAVILGADGAVVEGAYSALLWWRGDILCGPPADAARIDSVTARTVLTLATALGLDTFEEAVAPSDLAGTELWVLSALHGIRLATAWMEGPALAELPGRRAAWAARIDALRRPLDREAP